MKGIVAYGVYLPVHRIQRDVIAEAWKTRRRGGQKVCAGFDEDSITMAAAASSQCLATLDEERRHTISGLVFASTTQPYLERLNASIVGAICDLKPETLTVDVTGSLRAATLGLTIALDRVSADGDIALVCAADIREAQPGSADETIFSDAAAAVVVGSSNVIAELLAHATQYDDFFETSRRDRDSTVNSFDSKFAYDHGYQKALSVVLGMALQRADRKPRDIARLVVPSPDGRVHLQLAKKLGFTEGQVQNVLWDAIGFAGCATPLLLLADALETSRSGDLILMAGYGNGADALLFRVTDTMTGYKPRSSFKAPCGEGLNVPTYTLYRKARDFRLSGEDGLEITNVFYAKEEVQNIRLHGSECRACGTRHFPLTKVCARCRNEELLTVPLQRTGQVFTFAVDHLAPSPFPPVVMAVVDLDGGGRIYCEVVDVAADEVRIGMAVDLVMRRVREGGGLHHYYWKCRPRRWG